MPFMTMNHDKDPRKELLESIGDLSNIEIFNNQVLVAVYIRPTKTSSGLYIPDSTAAEDKYQGKVGLIIKKGPTAFIDETGRWFKDITFNEQEWVIFRPSDGWSITVNGVLCRIFDDINVRGRISSPDCVW